MHKTSEGVCLLHVSLQITEEGSTLLFPEWCILSLQTTGGDEAITKGKRYSNHHISWWLKEQFENNKNKKGKYAILILRVLFSHSYCFFYFLEYTPLHSLLYQKYSIFLASRNLLCQSLWYIILASVSFWQF